MLCLILSATGCTTGNPPDTARSSSAIPEFSGPWADGFRSGYENARSEIERKILATGTITEQQLVESREPLVTCLASRDVTISFDSTGGSTLTSTRTSQSSPERTQIYNECVDKTGTEVDFLYWQMKRNPDNLDEFTIVAQCLVDKKKVDPGYGATDYRRDFDSHSFPFSATDIEAGECQSNPLGVTY
ncbi:hypothetical protein M2390_003063 [Mycetocola sp. BIGb0189]|uniref:hypothetical protein n=1 Tax=Mycetocola sp. BIGb0189 TaxID=2940604 RepID=UPI0021679113|nr:hypothetical protein [Mycetocola sp. BIGb0189]MCS4277848.1 hypothetical protein [Mycetocola sp. BIGb0189]